MPNSEFKIPIPTIEGEDLELNISSDEPVIFVGANGSGKTRLAVFLESKFESSHRISAHRALSLNPKVPKIDEDTANRQMRTGTQQPDATIDNRGRYRWNNNQATHLLNDFDNVLQSLFAEFLNMLVEERLNKDKLKNQVPQESKFEKLTQIWNKLLPHRNIKIHSNDIQVSTNNCQSSYSASELSDGERAIFYLIGQTLIAPKNGLLIIDEPELHVHKSLMSDLWDLLESERKDCAFVFITHDLDFAASRVAQKIVLLEYEHPDKWKLETEPEKFELNEKITTLILGSRKSILFVEGTDNSLDRAIYGACFPDWTIVPCGGCKEVINSVNAMNKHENLHRTTCAGVIDADDRELYQQKYLKKKRVGVLPVAIIENLFLLPEISREIAVHEGCKDEELDDCLQQLKHAIFTEAKKPEIQESIIKKYCERIVHHKLKRINFQDCKNIGDMPEMYERETRAINIESMVEDKRKELMEAIDEQDLKKLLRIYNIKGLPGLLAGTIRGNNQTQFLNWIVRHMPVEKNGKIAQAIKSELHDVESTINNNQ